MEMSVGMEGMMDAFEKREEGFETAHAVAEALKFKTLARRNKLLGQWVAEQLGLEGAEAVAYARNLVDTQVGLIDDGALARRIGEALTTAKSDLSAHRIYRKIEEMTARAGKEIMEGI